MAEAARKVYETILRDGSVKAMLPDMQTRAQLYEVLNYHAYERKYDALQAADVRDGLRGGTEPE
jgi:methylisocitrate lyase